METREVFCPRCDRVFDNIKDAWTHVRNAHPDQAINPLGDEQQ